MKQVQVPRLGDIRVDTRKYTRKLGESIAKRRKSIGYTQAELARLIGVSQQAVFSYEIGDRRVPMIIAERIARAFKLTVDQLCDINPSPPGRKRRLSPRAMLHAERLQGLSKTNQRFVIKILDVLEVGQSAKSKQ